MNLALIQFLGYYLPLGVLSLATCAKEQGHEPFIFDLDVEDARSDIFDESADRILSVKPRLIGFSVICSFLPLALIIAKKCKDSAPDIPIVFGGAEVTFDDVPLLKTFNYIDLVVRGEGEKTFMELIDALETGRSFRGIPGITLRHGDSIVRNPDRPYIEKLDSLPFIDLSLLPDIRKYKVALIEGGRGCPYRCTFCSTCMMWKRKFRVKSPERIVFEMKKAYAEFRRYGFTNIMISHDNFLANRKWTYRFLRCSSQHAIPWSCNARLDSLDEELISVLRRSGCTSLYIGIESGSARVRRRIKKDLDIRGFWKMLRLLSDNGIRAVLAFVIGFPGEGAEDIDKTLTMALKARLFDDLSYTRIHSFTFLKGSELYDRWKDKLFAKPSERLEFSSLLWSSLLTDLPEERELIKKYPEIFPSFYQLGSDEFEPGFLQRLCVLYEFLCQFYPATAMSILKLGKMTPCELGEKMISSFTGQGVDWRYISRKPRDYFDHYRPYLRGFIFSKFKGRRKLTEELFLHEDLFLELCAREVEDAGSGPELSFSSRPRISGGVELKHYDHDVLNIVEKLAGRGVSLGRKKSILAYIPGDEPGVASLDPVLHDLLQLCDGRRTIEDMAEMTGLGAELKEQMLKTLQSLADKGLIKDRK